MEKDNVVRSTRSNEFELRLVFQIQIYYLSLR